MPFDVARFRGLTAALLLDITYLTSVQEDAATAKLGLRRHDKRHRSGTSAGHESAGSDDRPDAEQQQQQRADAAKDSASLVVVPASDLRVSHSLDEVKAHIAPNSLSDNDISLYATRSPQQPQQAAGAVASESVLTPGSPHYPPGGEGIRRRGHEHGGRSHDASLAVQSEMHAVQLSYLYLGAMKALSSLLSCSKYAELLLIPKVHNQHTATPIKVQCRACTITIPSPALHFDGLGIVMVNRSGARHPPPPPPPLPGVRCAQGGAPPVDIYILYRYSA